MIIERFDDGLVVCADSTTREVVDLFNAEFGSAQLVLTDPPYGNIVNEQWDRTNASSEQFAQWLTSWTLLWSATLMKGSAMYIWGGIGKPKFRPFFKYIDLVENSGELQLANLLTWSKKRGYGVQNNYLFTREECAYFVKGDAKKPRVFNVPHLSEKRGYAGYNENYPAKSEYYRRTNVWTDINEIFRGKKHPTQKAHRVMEVPIEVSTNPGDVVIDPFVGCGTTAIACRKLGRRFFVVEQDKLHFDAAVAALM